jgi:hypothetical protein
VRVDPSDADAFVLGTNTPSELVLAVEEARARASTTATPRLETMELPS